MSTAAKPKLLTRDEILAAKDREDEYVDVPKWGGTVRVLALTGTDRDRYLAGLMRIGVDDKGSPRIEGVNIEGRTVRLVAMSVVDEDDQPLFSPADVIALGQKSSSTLAQVEEVASRLSRLTTAVTEAVADLKADRNGSSGSD
jgi:hypothetical protein